MGNHFFILSRLGFILKGVCSPLDVFYVIIIFCFLHPGQGSLAAWPGVGRNALRLSHPDLPQCQVLALGKCWRCEQRSALACVLLKTSEENNRPIDRKNGYHNSALGIGVGDWLWGVLTTCFAFHFPVTAANRLCQCQNGIANAKLCE